MQSLSDIIAVDPTYNERGVALYLGDSLAIMRGMPSECVDFVLTDPPYAEKTIKGARTLRDLSKPLLGDMIAFTDEMLREAFDEIGRIARRWVVSFMDYQHVVMFEEHPPKGLQFIRFGIWRKTNGAPQFSGDRPGMGWEALCIMHKKRVRGDRKVSWNGGGRHAFYDVSIERVPKGQKRHPNRKPVHLLNRLIRDFSDPSDLVFDPFAGECSTGVAARIMERRAVCIEIDAEWIEVGKNRLSQLALPFESD